MFATYSAHMQIRCVNLAVFRSIAMQIKASLWYTVRSYACTTPTHLQWYVFILCMTLACQGMDLIGLPVSAMWTCRCKARGWEGSPSRASRMSCSARSPAGFSCPPAPACSSSDMPCLWPSLHFKHLCNLSRSSRRCHQEDR